jgi:hypothetical protein
VRNGGVHGDDGGEVGKLELVAVYMHQFKLRSRSLADLKLGKKYQVVGYHTGNFSGECVAMELGVAVFRVIEKTPKLKPGEKVEVHLNSASGAGVKIGEI